MVSKVRKILSLKRVGHGGTLDPMASGVLPIALGQSCRLIDYLPSDKVYLGEIELGLTTDTDDIEGAVLGRKETESIDENMVRTVVESFVGTVDQMPPAYSAIKVQGRKLYELARKGEAIEGVASRPVTFHSIDIIQMRLPRLTVRVKCSKGTYIRALARDIGEKLGAGGCLTSLVREEAGKMTLGLSVTLDDLERAKKSGQLCEHVIDPWVAIGLLPLEIDRALALRIRQGQRIPFSLIEATFQPGPAGHSEGRDDLVFAVADGLPVALLKRTDESFKPEVVFSDAGASQ